MTESITELADAEQGYKRSPRTNHPLNRLPPHCMESEQGVIGCILTDPNNCLLRCGERMRNGVEVFYDLRHQVIYETAQSMYSDMKPVDLITLSSELKDRQRLEQIGGIAYLSELQDCVPSAANLDYYLEKVLEKYLLRDLLKICSGVVGKIYDHEGDANALLNEVQGEFMRLGSAGDFEYPSMKKLVNEALVDVERMFTSKGEITGISTGFKDIDRETDGFHPGEYWMIGAFPSMGKTSIALNMGENAALNLGIPIGFISAEMTARSLVLRSLCKESQVNLRDVRDGRVSEADFPRMMNAAGRLSASKITIDDRSGLNVNQVRATVRRMVQKYGIKILFADYAQLFESPGSENRTNELDDVSKCFKFLAKELGITVVLLSQLTEDAKGGEGKLKGSRAFGEDADVYAMLKRPKDHKVDPDAEFDPVDFLIKKQRNGPRNKTIRLMFKKGITCFYGESQMPGA